jgi:predicted short-subunit dehydrogenase-like oxidoreductase (DUF2520 family)
MTARQHAIAIVGTGRVAQALGRALVDAGAPLVAIAGRRADRAAEAAAFAGASVAPIGLDDAAAAAERLLIAVSDDAVRAVARALAAGGVRGGVALHTSGAHGPELLDALRRAGVSCGVLHPLQTIPTPARGAAALHGAAFGVGGDAEAAEWAHEIVGLLGGTPLTVAPGGFAAYHAGAVMASNAVVAVLDAAIVLMRSAGVDGATALHAVGPLCLTSARNVIETGPDAALTGPVRRGDATTIRSHLAALSACPPHVDALYRASAQALVEISRRAGSSDASAAAIEQALAS